MKIRMTTLFLFLFTALFVGGCGFWGVRGNGNVKEESRQIEDFIHLDAAGAFTIKVNVGDDPH